jgi:putative nucleotidyltransferase with HDIG domain
MADTLVIPIDQVQIGLYIHLDLKWFQHPFTFGHFKVKSEDQLRTLRGLGIATVRVDPALSDVPVPAPVQPAALAPAPPAQTGQTPALDKSESPMMVAKRAMMARLREQRESTARIEQAFVDTARAVRDIDRNLFSQPAETMRVAGKLIGQITDSILAVPELAIHLMGDKLGGEEVYVHSLNVTMLSMMIARDIKLPHEVAKLLGMGALLHDIGMKNIPDKVLNKLEPYNRAEQALVETHCHGGVEIGQKLGLAAPALAIVRDHHELFDGSGYPRHLQGEAISVLSRIVSIANYYDELCNPRNPADALTPHEALSLMFAKMRSRFDPKLLQVFIRCLGVYPPGTIVQLPDGVVGMVVTVNTAKPTRPQVMIYDASVPREEAIMADLEQQPDLNIVRSIRPSQVPKEIYNYLSPRKRVSYFFDASEQGRRSQP